MQADNTMPRQWDAFLTAGDKEVYRYSERKSSLGMGVRPALLVIDATYDFAGEHPLPVLEAMKRWPLSCGQSAWDAISHIRTLLGVVRAMGIPVFFTTYFDAREDGVGRGRMRAPVMPGEKSSPGGPSGTDIVKDIAPSAQDFIIRKPRPSAFFGTRLVSLLNELQIDTLLVCGGTTSGCVRATVLDAYSYNYLTCVIEDCTFDRIESAHAVNLFDMVEKYADVRQVEEVVKYLASLSNNPSFADVQHSRRDWEQSL
jgi:nicotinamidase-related amidase